MIIFVFLSLIGMISLKSIFKSLSARKQKMVYIFYIVSKAGNVVFHDKKYYSTLDMAKAVGTLIRDSDFEYCDVKTALVALEQLDGYVYGVK